MLRPIDKRGKFSSKLRKRQGSNSIQTPKYVLLLVSILVVTLVFSGCKAQSTLTIDLRAKSSGVVEFELELDETAASAIRSDSYNSAKLIKVFEIEELEKAGFKTSVKDNINGDPSLIELNASFENEDELETILSYLVSDSVIKIDLESSETFLKQTSEMTFNVELSNLRKMYLENDEIKKAIAQAGIEFEEYRALVESAMKSTKVEIILEAGDETSTANFTGVDEQVEEISVKDEVFKSRFVFSIIGAVFFLIAGLVVLNSIRRRPKLLSKESKFSKEQAQ